MPRKKVDCGQAVLDALPSTRLELAIRLNLTAKIVDNRLNELVAAGLAHKSKSRVARPQDGPRAPRTNVLYLPGSAPIQQEPQKPTKRELVPDAEPRIDPTVRLFRDPLNAMFGM